MISKVNMTGKVMGNRMGLTGADARQGGKMYGCADAGSFKLCPLTNSTCETGNCICHSPYHKIQTNNCSRCMPRCSDMNAKKLTMEPEHGCFCPVHCKIHRESNEYNQTLKACYTGNYSGRSSKPCEEIFEISPRGNAHGFCGLGSFLLR